MFLSCPLQLDTRVYSLEMVVQPMRVVLTRPLFVNWLDHLTVCEHFCFQSQLVQVLLFLYHLFLRRVSSPKLDRFTHKLVLCAVQSRFLPFRRIEFALRATSGSWATDTTVLDFSVARLCVCVCYSNGYSKGRRGVWFWMQLQQQQQNQLLPSIHLSEHTVWNAMTRSLFGSFGPSSFRPQALECLLELLCVLAFLLTSLSRWLTNSIA